MAGEFAAGAQPDAARYTPVPAGAEYAGRAAMAATGAKWIFGPKRGLDGWSCAASRHRQQLVAACRRVYRPECGCEPRTWATVVQRNQTDRRSCRKPATGHRVVADGPRIP